MESIDLATLWTGMLNELKQTLPKLLYMNWFESSLIPISYNDNHLTLGAVQNFVITYVSKNYSTLLNQVAQNITQQPDTTVSIVLLETTAPAPSAPPVEVPKPAEPSQPDSDELYGETISLQQKNVDFVQPEIPGIDPYHPAEAEPPALEVHEAAVITPPDKSTKDNLIKNYTFENFIVGSSNRVSYSIATAVADAPAQKYNPLYIYGGSGLGKTHLMHAIGHRILQKFPYMRLRCITSEDFVNDFIQAIQDKNTENFRQQYRNIDVLLVDDIQFLGQGDKDSSKEEFFHTFNKLYQGQKQMVFTSDRPPQDIKRLEDRLRSRFQSGMVTGIEPPDLETRTAILRTWAKQDNVMVESDAINYIAANVSENIRDLRGAYNNVLSRASMEHSGLTMALTQEALKYLINEKEEKKYITIDEITKAVCEFYNVNYKELMGKKKTKEIALPRQIAMYLCRELTGNTYPHIGTAFNGRDHTTVMHAYVKIMKMIEKDSRFKESIDKLKNKILGVDK